MTDENKPISSGEVCYDEKGVTIRFDVFEHYLNFSVEESGYLDAPDNVMNGFIKWDGCSHFYFGDAENDGYLHLCGLQNVKRFAWTVEEVYRIAEREIPTWADYVAGKDK